MEFSPGGGFLAASDTVGLLVIFDIVKGIPAHLVQFPPLVHVSSLRWRNLDQLVIGCTDGVVAMLRFTRVRDEVSQPCIRTLPTATDIFNA